MLMKTSTVICHCSSNDLWQGNQLGDQEMFSTLRKQNQSGWIQNKKGLLLLCQQRKTLYCLCEQSKIFWSRYQSQTVASFQAVVLLVIN